MPHLTVISADGTRRELDVEAGLTILDISRRYDIDIEGACEGCMACTTCHVIVAPEWFDRLPEPSEDEEDMLDIAWGLTPTSRLGCQVVVTDELDGLVVTLPERTNNMLDSF